MSIATMEEEIVDRDSFREVSQVAKTSQVYWTAIIPQYTTIKQSRYVDNILIKQSWHSLSHPFICLLCLLEVDLEEGQSGFKPLYSTHFRKS